MQLYHLTFVLQSPPKRLTGKQLLAKYAEVKKQIVKSILPIYEEICPKGVAPSGTNYKEILREILHGYSAVEALAKIQRRADRQTKLARKRNAAADSGEDSGEDSGDEDNDSEAEEEEAARRPAATPAVGPDGQPYVKIIIPTMWMAFVRLGPFALEHCHAQMMSTEGYAVKEGEQKKGTFGRNNQRAGNKAARTEEIIQDLIGGSDSEEEAPAFRTPKTPSAVGSARPQLEMDEEMRALTEFNRLTAEANQIKKFELCIANLEKMVDTCKGSRLPHFQNQAERYEMLLMGLRERSLYGDYSIPDLSEPRAGSSNGDQVFGGGASSSSSSSSSSTFVVPRTIVSRS